MLSTVVYVTTLVLLLFPDLSLQGVSSGSSWNTERITFIPIFAQSNMGHTRTVNDALADLQCKSIRRRIYMLRSTHSFWYENIIWKVNFLRRFDWSWGCISVVSSTVKPKTPWRRVSHSSRRHESIGNIHYQRCYTGIIRHMETQPDGDVCRNPPPDDWPGIATICVREKIWSYRIDIFGQIYISWFQKEAQTKRSRLTEPRRSWQAIMLVTTYERGCDRGWSLGLCRRVFVTSVIIQYCRVGPIERNVEHDMNMHNDEHVLCSWNKRGLQPLLYSKICRV